MQSVLLEQAKVGWPLVSKIISVPHTEAEYERAVEMLDTLIDEVGESEEHPLASLMDTLGCLIESYEDAHYPEPTGDPLSSLRILMTDHKLDLKDLPEIGDSKTIEDILSGHRDLTQTQIHLLGKRFHVSPTVFL